MLLKNLQQGSLVNGSVGKIVRFATATEAQHAAAARYGTSYKVDESKPPGPEPSDPTMRRVQKGRPWPVVEFVIGKGIKKELLCVPHDFTVNNANGDVEASRVQVCCTTIRSRFRCSYGILKYCCTI
jgi:hypothetical protein